MKVLMINGSPRKDGNTARALKEIADTLKAEGVESEVVWLGNSPRPAQEPWQPMHFIR